MRGRRSTAATSTAACAGHSRSHLTNGVPTRTQKHENAKTRNNLKVFFFVVSCFRGFVIVRVYETRSSTHSTQTVHESYCCGEVVRVRSARPLATRSFTSLTSAGTWYGMPSLIVHSMPPPCTLFTFASPGFTMPE